MHVCGMMHGCLTCGASVAICDIRVVFYIYVCVRVCVCMYIYSYIGASVAMCDMRVASFFHMCDMTDSNV